MIKHHKFNRFIVNLFLLLLFLMIMPFTLYSFVFGYSTLENGFDSESHLFNAGDVLNNHAISIHMVFGAIIQILAPIQVFLGWQVKFMRVHKFIGYLFVISAISAGVAGCWYILFKGTVGLLFMDVAFGIYGLLVIICAVMTLKTAINRQLIRHQQWALRLFVLAIASWLYRIEIGFWVWLNGSFVGHTADYQGYIDYILEYAFYVPGLLLLEIYFRLFKQKPINPLPLVLLITLLSVFMVIGFLIVFGDLLGL